MKRLLMPLYRAYAETRVGAGPTKRFLLDTDIGPLGGGPLTVVNRLDLDDVSPKPDLGIRVIVHALNSDHLNAEGTRRLTDTHLEIRFEPEPGRELTNVDVQVFVNTSDNVHPLGGAPTPNPSSYVYIRYHGAVGQVMPTSLAVHLSTRKLRTGPGQADLFVDDEVDIVAISTPVAGPLQVSGGQLKGTVELRPAVPTRMVGNVYTVDPAVDVRYLGINAPDAILANLAVSTPGMPVFPLDCFWVGIQTDHLTGTTDRVSGPAAAAGTPVPPGTPTAPSAALAGSGPGLVDRGRHRYKVAFRLANGRETAPGEASAPVVVANSTVDGKVRLTQLPVGLSTAGTQDVGVEVVARRVYRTLAGATGDDGEFRFVKEVADNTTVVTDDDVADAALGDPPADRMTVHISSRLRHDIVGDLTLRTAGVEDRFEAELRGVPTDARVFYTTRPTVDRPRVRWQADALLGSAVLRLPTLRSGDFRRGEVRLRVVPQFLGAHWYLLGPDVFVLELGGPRRGEPVETPIVSAEVLLTSAPAITWRDAPQAVVVEQVKRQFDDGTLRSARTRVGVKGLRRARVAFGEAGARHARASEGVTVQLLLGPEVRDDREKLFRPGRALRMLVLNDTSTAGVRDHSHVAVRAGALPDELDLDLRIAGDYFGVYGTGAIERLKALVLTDPSAGRPAYDADRGRIWVTIPQTPRQFEVIRTGGDATVQLAGRVFAEASVRDPTGLQVSADPLRHAKVAAIVPTRARVGRSVVVYGSAGAGTTGSTLVDPDVLFDAGHANASIRYLTGPNATLRQAVTAVAADGTSITTAPFPTAPAVGDRYALEDREGLSVETSLDGRGVEARIAVSKDLDRFVATRSTPQVRLRTAALPGAPEGSVPSPQLRALTARVYGVRAASLAVDPAGPMSVPVLLDPGRVNKSLRAGIRTQEDPVGTIDRDLLKARVEVLPPELRIDADPVAGVFGGRLSVASGPGVFWMEPPLVRGPAAGPRAGQRAGTGLVQFQFDLIPRAVRATVLGPGAFPANFNPGPGFVGGGLRAEVSEMASIDFLRYISWSRDHRDDLNKIFWSRIDATFVRWNQDAPAVAPAPPVMVPIDIWMFSEADPADENSPDSGIGYSIPTPGVTMTLDLDTYAKTVNLAAARWSDLPGDWQLGQELQMASYAGTVSLSTMTSGIAAGDPSAGPGTWFLRLVGGLDWNPAVGFGSAYFGNTGGWVGSRPRIFT